jgi:ElaB/YqjD/DUF883 family membrane-anchored ribosome-binding protein
MDNEAEVTLEQMEETRGALSEKMEALGHQVADTMRDATTAVHDTVENVKDTFDLRLQVKRHPWGLAGGAIALGCLGGYLLHRRRSERSRANGRSEPASRGSPGLTRPGNGGAKVHRLAEETPAKEPGQEGAPCASEPGWLTGVNHRFGAEITKVKGLAIGTVLSFVRDLIMPSVPEHLKPGLAGVMDSVTVKLGGEPVRGPLLKAGFQGGRCAEGEEEERDSSERGDPPGSVQRHSATAVRTVG